METRYYQPPVSGDDVIAALREYSPDAAGVEPALLQLQRLAIVGRLATEVAHDFGNLMTVILGYSELILTAAEHGQPPEHEQLSELRQAAGRASELTSRLLGYSCRATEEPTPLDLGQMVQGLTSLLARLAGMKANLVVRADAAAGAVLADAAAVEQVIINLVLNARDATAEGDNVEVTVDPIRLAADLPHRFGTARAGDYVRLRVRDDGRGMTAEDTARLFRPFYTTKSGGTGLGLVMVARVARKANAAIVVDSTPGVGTTVDLLFPRLGDGAS